MGGRLEMEGAQGDRGGLRRGSQRGESRLVGEEQGERKCCALWIIVCLSSGMV